MAALARRLAEPRTVLALIGLYCLVHYLLRLSLSELYTLDESEQALLSEAWRMGYRFRHPPLMTWIYAGVEDAFGLNRWSFLAVKYVVLAAGLAAFHRAALLILGRRRDAALALGGVMLIAIIAVQLHIDLTHSALMTAMSFVCLHAFARAALRGGWADWGYLGAALGLGTLAKYAFLLLPAGLIAGLLLTPGLRARVRPARFAAALALGAAIVAPYAAWAALEGYSMTALTAEVVGVYAGAGNPVLGWISGSLSLLWALILAASPLILVFLALYPEALRPASDGIRADWKRLIGIALATGALLTLSALFFLGGGDFKPRWFFPLAAALPLWLMLAARLGGARPGRRDAVFAGLAGAAVLGVVALRVALHAGAPQACQPECRTEQPVAGWAADLREAGFAGGTIVTNDYHLGGNLRAAMPEARVIGTQFPYAAYAPPSGEGQCLIAWNTLNLHLKDAMFDYARSELGVSLAEESPEGVLVRGLPRNPDYEMALNYRFAEPTEECR